VEKFRNAGKLCTCADMTPISWSVIPPSAAATSTIVHTSASGASSRSSLGILPAP
jgi:hypothetical protein